MRLVGMPQVRKELERISAPTDSRRMNLIARSIRNLIGPRTFWVKAGKREPLTHKTIAPPNIFPSVKALLHRKKDLFERAKAGEFQAIEVHSGEFLILFTERERKWLHEYLEWHRRYEGPRNARLAIAEKITREKALSEGELSRARELFSPAAYNEIISYLKRKRK